MAMSLASIYRQPKFDAGPFGAAPLLAPRGLERFCDCHGRAENASGLSCRIRDDTDFRRHLKRAGQAMFAFGAQKPSPGAFPYGEQDERVHGRKGQQG